MKQNIVFAAVLSLAAYAAQADSLLEAAGKQVLRQEAEAVAPGALQNAEAAGQALEAARHASPEAVKAAATATAQEKLKAVAPERAQQAVETIQSGKKALKAAPKSTDQAVKAAKTKAKQKAAEKVLDLLH